MTWSETIYPRTQLQRSSGTHIWGLVTANGDGRGVQEALFLLIHPVTLPGRRQVRGPHACSLDEQFWQVCQPPNSTPTCRLCCWKLLSSVPPSDPGIACQEDALVFDSNANVFSGRGPPAILYIGWENQAERMRFILFKGRGQGSPEAQSSAKNRPPAGWHTERSQAPRHPTWEEDTGDRLPGLGSPHQGGVAFMGWQGEQQGRDLLQRIVGSLFWLCRELLAYILTIQRDTFRNKVFCSQ